jgi:hypothetical protein
VQPGLLWAGSDDGLVHLSRDDGAHWQDVTPPDLPAWALIASIDPSPHEPTVCYLAANRYKHDDFRPYLFKTSDGGQSWTPITEGIPADDFTRVIREDPARRGLLYAGTETGVYVSFDDGGHWQRLGGRLPVVPVHDLVVKDGDLVLATHGRGFWILDDLSPLRQIDGQEGAKLFAPRTTVRFLTNRGFGTAAGPGNNYQGVGAGMVTFRMVDKGNGEKREQFMDAGQNPPDGVLVNYFLPVAVEGEVALAFLDAQGNEIRRFSSEAPEDEGTTIVGGGGASQKKEPRVPKEPGINRFAWNLRAPDAVTVPGAVFRSGGVDGPKVPPGRYQVRLTVGDQSLTQPFEIVKDPRVPATQEDFQAQYELLLKIRDTLSSAHEAVNQIRDLRGQIEFWEGRARGRDGAERIAEAATSLKAKLKAIEDELIESRLKVPKDPLHYPIKLNNKLAALSATVVASDDRPTAQSSEVFDKLSDEVHEQLDLLAELGDAEIPRFQRLVTESGVPLVG